MRVLILLLLSITAGFAASQFLNNKPSMRHQDVIRSKAFQNELKKLACYHAAQDIQNKSVPVKTLQALNLLPNPEKVDFACIQPNVAWNYNDYYHAELTRLFPESSYAKELKRRFFTSLKPLRKQHKPYAL